MFPPRKYRLFAGKLNKNIIVNAYIPDHILERVAQQRFNVEQLFPQCA